MGDEAKRTPVAAGNWKMNLTRDAARKLVDEIKLLSYQIQGIEIVLAPPAVLLPLVGDWVSGSPIRLAAQNVHWEEKGAFTGEVSAPMLKECGCAYALIGHSERRHVFGESDAWVGRKVRAAVKHDLPPILCVGEKLEEREAGRTIEVVERQLAAALEGLGASEIGGLIVAYEPVWAIGTGKNASGKDAQEAHGSIRGWLAKRFNAEIAGRVRILYGGSVTPGNIPEIIAQKDVDGTLVGGASLKAETFASIIKSSMKR